MICMGNIISHYLRFLIQFYSGLLTNYVTLHLADLFWVFTRMVFLTFLMLKEEYSRINKSIPWLLMPWFLPLPRKDFNYLHHISIKKLNMRHIYFLVSWNISSTKMVNSLRLGSHLCVVEQGHSLVQIMSCCLFNAKPLSEPVLEYCWLSLRNKLQRNLNWNSYIFIQKDAFENILRKWQPFCLSLNVLTTLFHVKQADVCPWWWDNCPGTAIHLDGSDRKLKVCMGNIIRDLCLLNPIVLWFINMPSTGTVYLTASLW